MDRRTDLSAEDGTDLRPVHVDSGFDDHGVVRLPEPAPGSVPLDETITPWRAWHPVTRATSSPPRCRRPVAGGWAIDLHVGRSTRDHDDLEISVLAAVLAAFPEPGWQWAAPFDGYLHRHDPGSSSTTHQNWLWSPADRAFVLDDFREPHEGDMWICRRDPALRRPWQEVVPSHLRFVLP